MRGLRVSLCALILVTVAAACSAEVPARADSGQRLTVPEELLERGEVYHVVPGQSAQLTIVSAAALQQVVLTSDRLVGFVVTPWEIEGQAPPLVAGALRIPLSTLRSGSESLDRFLAGLLQTAANPEATFVITGVQDAQRDSSAVDGAWDLTVAGLLSIRGQAVQKSARVRMELHPFRWRTMNQFVGEALTLRATFDLTLQELGVTLPAGAPAQLADRVRVEVFLLCNTVPPDKSLDPAVPQAENQRHLKILTLLRDLDQPAEGYALAAAFAKDHWESGTALARLAGDILREPGIRQRDAALARRLAQRAAELSGSDPGVLETLALAAFQVGDLEEAVRRQAAAIEAAPAPARDALRGTLDRYQAAQRSHAALPAAAAPPQ